MTGNKTHSTDQNIQATGNFSLMRASEFQQQYGGLEKVEQYGANIGDNLILACIGDAVLSETLSLFYREGWDSSHYEEHASFLNRFGITVDKDEAKDITGIAVTGNLTIHGKLDDSAERSAFLYVGGGLFSDYVYADNALIYIGGDSVIKDMVWANYNGGVIEFARKLTTPILLSTGEHSTEVCDPDVSLYAFDSNFDEWEETKSGKLKVPAELKAVVKKDIVAPEDINPDMFAPKAIPAKMEILRQTTAEWCSTRRKRAFMDACKENLERVKYFVEEKGFDVNMKLWDSYPIVYASKGTKIENISYLLEQGASLEEPIATDALIAACVSSTKEVVKFLLVKGANANAQHEDGRTPLFIAVQNKNLELPEVLLEAGADPKQKNADGTSFLKYLLEKSEYKMIPLAIKYGADPADCNWNPLFCAVIKNDLPEVRKLIGSYDINEKDEKELAPIQYAVLHDYREMIRFLIESEADIETKNRRGTTPFYSAAIDNHIEIIKILAEAGAEINSPRPDGYRPIDVAVQLGNAETVKFLLAKGVCPNTSDKDIPLIFSAVNNRHKEVTKLLLEAGADINKKYRDKPFEYYVNIFLKDEEILELVKTIKND